HSEYGFGEFLAAGPQMMDRWLAGGGYSLHPGCAIISAAVDCRRAGFSKAIPSHVLKALYRDYLDVGLREHHDVLDFTEHLRWASQRVSSASSCLVPQGDDRYLASDYLIDRTLIGTGPLAERQVSDQVWSELLSLGDDEILLPIGTSAYYNGRLDIAE